MPKIIVCGLAAAPQQMVLHGATSVISILGPETPHPVYAPHRHLALTFNDINASAEGMVSAADHDAERLVAFIRSWDKSAPMVIHCWAGISRSTASAFSALCILRENESEMNLAAQLRKASPSATPNRLITSLVDRHLGRKGRMVKAVESIGRGADAFEGKPFELFF
ncbi:MAG: tyrosine protein phosphatase [Aestuariivirga sp.]